jgi:hypothetical protein
MAALGPASRADGVAYLCVTPFGAGQALTVRSAVAHGPSG